MGCGGWVTGRVGAGTCYPPSSPLPHPSPTPVSPYPTRTPGPTPVPPYPTRPPGPTPGPPYTTPHHLIGAALQGHLLLLLDSLCACIALHRQWRRKRRQVEGRRWRSRGILADTTRDRYLIGACAMHRTTEALTACEGLQLDADCKLCRRGGEQEDVLTGGGGDARGRAKVECNRLCNGRDGMRWVSLGWDEVGLGWGDIGLDVGHCLWL